MVTAACHTESVPAAGKYWCWFVSVPVLLVCVRVALPAFQRPFREYPPMESDASTAPIPPDYRNPAEFVLGRLMYPSTGRGRGGGGDWTRGGAWTVDYPRAERHFALALRRLTRVDVRSVEQPVNPDDGDDIFHWPYLHVGMPTGWNFTPAQASKIREYLLRGGFMICDSFFGSQEWAGFERGMKQIFPDRPITELANDDPVFHTAYDLAERYQVGNFRSRFNERWYRSEDGGVPHWRGIRDDHGRVVVVINFNNDLGDSWQLADNPEYPQKFSYMGIRLGVNYVVYSLTH